jgi:hypothetical protein
MANSRSILLVLMLSAGFGPAATASAPPLPAAHSPSVVAAAAPVVFAEAVSWHGFLRFWRSFVNRADRVVLVVGVVAAAALFIITRGRWNK